MGPSIHVVTGLIGHPLRIAAGDLNDHRGCFAFKITTQA